jgi:hypothetical protein
MTWFNERTIASKPNNNIRLVLSSHHPVSLEDIILWDLLVFTLPCHHRFTGHLSPVENLIPHGMVPDDLVYFTG